MNTEAPDVGRRLRLFTFLPEDEIRRLESLEGADVRAGKEVLAFETTRLTHGDEAAREAQASARALFGDGSSDANFHAVPTTSLPEERLSEGVEVVDLFVISELAPSKAAARRLIEQGGAYLGDRRVDRADTKVTRRDLGPNGVLLRAGKKRYHRIVVSTTADG